MSGMGKPGDQQTWVYGQTSDSWFGGATSGGSGGGAVVTVNTSSQWALAVDIDFTNQSPQTFTSDGAYTIAGYSWQKDNSANEATHASIGVVGLNFQPASTSDLNTTTYTAPTLSIPLASLIPGYTLDLPIRVWLYIAANNAAANFDGSDFVIGNATPAIASGSTYFRAAKGNAGSGLAHYFAVNLNGTRPSNQATADYYSNNVEVIILPNGSIGPNAILLSGLGLNNAWPAESSLNPESTAAWAGGAVDLTTVSTPGAQRLILGAHRAGSGTALSVTFTRLRVEYLSPIIATINISSGTTTVPGAFAAYDGYCTGSLLWNATGSWANALSVPGNFTDVQASNISRSGSVFTVSQTGAYRFKSSFNAMAGANGTYIAYRLSGSSGPVISRTTFATDNPQLAELEGIFQANAGSTYTLQYLTSGSAEQSWSTSDPNGVGVDTQNMVTGRISIFLIPSGSTTYNISNVTNTQIVTGTVIAGSPNANYAFVSQSNQLYFDNTVAGFVPLAGMSASITTTGSPVLIMANAFWAAQSAGAQAFFSLNRNGVNLGSQYTGLMGAGPTVASYGQNASYAYVDFVPAGTYTYQYTASGSIGSGNVGAWGVGPSSFMLFEMKNANVVTASTTLSQAVPGGNLIGLSASIFVNRGPVLCIASTNMSSDASGNWCWFDIFRNGSSLANGASQGLSINVGSATNEIQNNCLFVLDQSPTIGATNTYNLRATNGAGTNHVNFNNQLSSLILWELTDVNYKYSFSTSQITPATNPSYTDIDPQNPTGGLITRGRPVLLMTNINSNTAGGGGRNGYSFFRNGQNVTTASKGMQLPDGEGNNDWNKMATMFWIDKVSPGFYQYQAVGTVVSSSAFTAQGSYTYLFMYELDPGIQNGNTFGGWLDVGNALSTTASVAISDASENFTKASQKGADVYFYVSGTSGIAGASGRKAVFGGDVVVSGSLSGSHSTLTDGVTPYIVGTGGIQTTTGSSGQVTVALSASYANISTAESTTSTSYTDLATVGPVVTVNVGPSGKLMLTYGAYITPLSNGWYGVVSPQLSGANTLAAADVNWVIFGSNTSAVYGAASRTIVLTGLNPGATTVTLKYKSGQSGFSWQFQNRDLTAIPL